MKKTISIFLILTLIFSLSACGTKNSSPAPSGSAPSNNTSSTQSSPGIPYSPEIDPEADPFKEIAGAKVDTLPFEGSKKLTVKPTTGIWFTTITIEKDGTFKGSYRENSQEEFSEHYPNGKIFVCDFTGNFSEFKKIDNFTYALKLDTLYANLAPDESWIEDGILYETASPIGVENGYVFYLYLPGKPTKDFTDAELSWFFGNVPANLTDYALTNSYDAIGYTATYTFLAD